MHRGLGGLLLPRDSLHRSMAHRLAGAAPDAGGDVRGAVAKARLAVRPGAPLHRRIRIVELGVIFSFSSTVCGG